MLLVKKNTGIKLLHKSLIMDIYNNFFNEGFLNSKSTPKEKINITPNKIERANTIPIKNNTIFLLSPNISYIFLYSAFLSNKYKIFEYWLAL